MMKRVLLSAVSAVAIAACSATPDGYLYEDYMTNPETRSAIPVYGSRDPMVNEDASASPEARELRKEMARITKGRVHYGFDSASLSAEAQEELTKIAGFIKNNTGSVEAVTIEGHADERGTREYNLALGDRRAVSAKKFLVGLGVDAGMINTISYGKERPVDSGHNEDAWAKNRRAVIILD
jgi:peptidoglycan-associated lipoprotein